MANLHPLLVQILSLSAWLLLLCAVFVPLERLVSIQRQAVFRPQLLTDLGWYALNSIIVGLVVGGPVVLMGAAVHQLIPWHVLEAIAALPWWVRLILGLVVGDIGYYWGHRFTHEIPLLWRFHAIHHSATQVDFLTSTRAHPVDMVFPRIWGFIPVLALGLTGGSGTIAILVLMAGTVWGFFIHANVRWRFGFLEHVISTPFFHHWHHTDDRRRDGNYAAMFAFVDHLFGTYVSPKHWPTGYGIDAPMPSSLGRQLLHPFLPSPRLLRTRPTRVPPVQEGRGKGRASRV